MIPERSAKAKAALDVFFDQHNDVHFYVEDSEQQNFYKVLLQKLFPRLKITRVFPLDGKPNVVRHASDGKTNSMLRKPQIYIVDKDFDDLLGTQISIPNLFYLKRYCIENHLLDEDAVLGMVIDHAPKTDRDKLQAQLHYEDLYQQIVEEVRPVFELFFLAQKHQLGIRSTKLAPERFVDKNLKVDPEKLSWYSDLVAPELVKAGVISSASELDALRATALPKSVPACANISGKFLMKMVLLHLRLQKHIGNINEDAGLFALARNTEARSLKELGVRIRRHLRKNQKNGDQKHARARNHQTFIGG